MKTLREAAAVVDAQQDLPPKPAIQQAAPHAWGRDSGAVGQGRGRGGPFLITPGQAGGNLNCCFIIMFLEVVENEVVCYYSPLRLSGIFPAEPKQNQGI